MARKVSYLTIIPGLRVGCEMVHNREGRGAECRPS